MDDNKDRVNIGAEALTGCYGQLTADN